MLTGCPHDIVASGMRSAVPSSRVTALAELILAEQACCAFLRFGLTFDGPTVSLTVTGPDQAQPLIAALLGQDEPEGAPL